MRWWMFSQGSPWTPTRATLRRHRHGHARHAADAVEHVQLLLDLRVAERVRPRRPGRCPPPPSGARSTAGSCPGWPAPTVDGDRGACAATSRSAAATAVGDLVDDLSNWYVRRSRRRFWRTDPDAPAGDTLAAQATLHEVLTTLSLLLAPMCPFVSDAMWRHLTGADDGRRRLGAPGRLARGRHGPASTPSSRRRWRWPGA